MFVIKLQFQRVRVGGSRDNSFTAHLFSYSLPGTSSSNLKAGGERGEGRLEGGVGGGGVGIRSLGYRNTMNKKEPSLWNQVL